jgi:pyruvate/2-oxoglutarate dehydrogenase complex dihydrolipoamide dehydrogenase (E3) component
MAEFDYDLLVIGSGPAGQRAAIQGAKLNKKVAVVERKTVVGGVSVNLGTIPQRPSGKRCWTFPATGIVSSMANPSG